MRRQVTHPTREFRYVCGACGGESVYVYAYERYADMAAAREGWGHDPIDPSVRLCPACMHTAEGDYED